MTGERQSAIAYGLSLAIGLILWTITAKFGKRIEPWDADIYWSLFYPLAILISGILGYFFPRRPWRWAATLMLSQLIVMLAGGAGLSLLPLGLVMLAFLTLPAAGLGLLASRIALRGT